MEFDEKACIIDICALISPSRKIRLVICFVFGSKWTFHQDKKWPL
jgi:hypothetical protein